MNDKLFRCVCGAIATLYEEGKVTCAQCGADKSKQPNKVGIMNEKLIEHVALAVEPILPRAYFSTCEMVAKKAIEAINSYKHLEACVACGTQNLKSGQACKCFIPTQNPPCLRCKMEHPYHTDNCSSKLY